MKNAISSANVPIPAGPFSPGLSIGGWIFLSRSFPGFRLQVGGMAPLAARYAGFSQRGALWSTLLISGALAGLAGAIEVVGYHNRLILGLTPGYGAMAILNAVLGRMHPLGVRVANSKNIHAACR